MSRRGLKLSLQDWVRDYYMNQCDCIECFTNFILGAWQVGELPSNFVKGILNRSNITIDHTARQITDADFSKFDYMFGMDNYNLRELKKFAKATSSHTKVALLGMFNPDENDKIIADPYFNQKQEDFEKCFTQISQSCEMLMKKLLSGNQIIVQWMTPKTVQIQNKFDLNYITDNLYYIPFRLIKRSALQSTQ